MGADIHVYMGYKNKEVKLYNYKKEKNEFFEVPIFDGRNSDLFDYILEHCYPLNTDFPIPDSIRNSYEEEKTWCYGFKEMSLADMALHILLRERDDRIGDEEEGFEEFKDLFERAKMYFNFWNDEDYDPSFSNVKLYMWFDR